ncbi:ubiquitin carboxyl-terminal hydrolase 26-like [Cucurbita maxima]|uniref:Ubiquitin carboxyl-terminal hydrolase 26-like n=1 Tax=Cucurbita maxima TaxID=3661 RepID=A0A6J1KTW7_CUCMA|nr:ubiquitin carboxyl-terminal hydrolase 26-like [Cucurbita maxima]
MIFFYLQLTPSFSTSWFGLFMRVLYPDGTYFVSRTWLQQWAKRKILDAPSKADSEPTASIRCPHGQLLPEQAARAKRLLVPDELWFFIHEDAITVKPDDPTGVPTFPSVQDNVLCAVRNYLKWQSWKIL